MARKFEPEQDDVKRCLAVAENLRRMEIEEAKAQGQLEQVRADLKESFGCDDVRGMEAVVKKLEATASQQLSEFNRLLDRFEEDHGKRLDQWTRGD